MVTWWRGDGHGRHGRHFGGGEMAPHSCGTINKLSSFKVWTHHVTLLIFFFFDTPKFNRLTFSLQPSCTPNQHQPWCVFYLFIIFWIITLIPPFLRDYRDDNDDKGAATIQGEARLNEAMHHIDLFSYLFPSNNFFSCRLQFLSPKDGQKNLWKHEMHPSHRLSSPISLKIPMVRPSYILLFLLPSMSYLTARWQQ